MRDVALCSGSQQQQQQLQYVLHVVKQLGEL
jgi:hypothetical protein